MTNLSYHLLKNPIFQKLPTRDLDLLASQGTTTTFQAGEFLCHQGDIWPYAAFVLSGVLRWAILSLSGREHVLFRIEGENIFWGHSIYDGQPMPASLTAAQRSRVCLWHQDVIAPVLTRNPETLWEIIRYQSATMRRARDVIYGLAFHQVAGRLAKLLLDQASGKEGQSIQREMTLSEIAATVASSQEVVCRVLYQFQADNLIELTRATFTVKDAAALDEIIE